MKTKNTHFVKKLMLGPSLLVVGPLLMAELSTYPVPRLAKSLIWTSVLLKWLLKLTLF